VNMFEVVPPGRHPIKMSEMANTGSNLRMYPSAKAIKGINPNCDKNPMKTPFELRKTALKSAMVRLAPIPSIMAKIIKAKSA